MGFKPNHRKSVRRDPFDGQVPTAKEHAELQACCRFCNADIQKADREKGPYMLELTCPDCSVGLPAQVKAISYMFPHGIPDRERQTKIREHSIRDYEAGKKTK